ncbi:unnamed protein product, partial [Discosporangium mesarthrocarpum]
CSGFSRFTGPGGVSLCAIHQNRHTPRRNSNDQSKIMADLFSHLCTSEGCTVRSKYGYRDGPPILCGGHKLSGMVTRTNQSMLVATRNGRERPKGDWFTISRQRRLEYDSIKANQDLQLHNNPNPNPKHRLPEPQHQVHQGSEGGPPPDPVKSLDGEGEAGNSTNSRARTEPPVPGQGSKSPQLNNDNVADGHGCRVVPRVTPRKPGSNSYYRPLCEHRDCTTQASYGLEGTQRPIFCTLHKEEDMVSLKNRLCIHSGCKVRALFGLKGSRATHCVNHKTKEMGHAKSREAKEKEKDKKDTNPSKTMNSNNTERKGGEDRDDGGLANRVNDGRREKGRVVGAVGRQVSQDEGRAGQSLHSYSLAENPRHGDR